MLGAAVCSPSIREIAMQNFGDKRYWNKGYGSDTIWTLLRHAFETLNLNRVSL